MSHLFVSRLGDLYRNRGELIAEQVSERRGRGGGAQADSKEAIENVTKLTSMLKKIMTELGSILKQKGDQLILFDDHAFPELPAANQKDS